MQHKLPGMQKMLDSILFFGKNKTMLTILPRLWNWVGSAHTINAYKDVLALRNTKLQELQLGLHIL